MKNIPLPLALGIIAIAGALLFVVLHFSERAQQSVLPLAPVEQSATTIDEVTPKEILIQEEGDDYSINVSYPGDLPQEVREYIETSINDFRVATEGERFTDIEYTFSLSVTEYEAGETESYLVEQSAYTGGANNNTQLQAFVYRDGGILSLEQITNVDQIRSDVIDEFDNEYGKDWFTGSFELTDGSFYIPKEDMIGFAFSEYSVLPGVYGSITVELDNPYKPKASTRSSAISEPEVIVESFDQCIEEGGMILEIFPRQCVFSERSFTESLGKDVVPGDGIELELLVGPERQECGSFSRQPCLIVNGNNFYDTIEGFEFKPGIEQRIRVNRTLRFGTDNPVEIPQDVGLYKFSLIEVLSEKKVSQAPNNCVIAGCSSQLCISQEDVDAGGGISTCEYREEYACYIGASCEVQVTGECGWTETPELAQCIENPPSFN